MSHQTGAKRTMQVQSMPQYRRYAGRMTEAFKLLIDPAAITAIRTHVERAGGRSFDRNRFEQLALTGLNTLELKARVMQVERALVASLPADVDHAAG